MDLEELRSAVKDGKLERVQELIGSKDLGSPSELLYGRNLLLDAIEAGRKDIIKLLLDQGANVNVHCDEGFSHNLPLATAVRKRDTEIVRMLLDKGANIKAKYQWGPTPLREAITLGDTNMVKLLLDHKADVYDTFFKFSSALDHACTCENPEIIDLLISRGAKMGKTSVFCFDNTRNNNGPSGNDNSNSNDLSSDVDSDDNDEGGSNPLHVAIQRGYVHLVEHYLKRGSNVNSRCNLLRKKGYTPLHFACERHSKEVLKVLLRFGADVNAKAEDEMTPLLIAVNRNKAEFVEMLLLCEANVDAHARDGRTALYIAAANGDTQNVKTILKHRPGINNESNKNSLKAAVSSYGEDEREDIIRHLLLYGFSTRIESTDEIVLHLAVRKGYLHFVDDFLKGTDINSVYRDTLDERQGYTLLHTACEKDRVHMIRYLLLKGAYVNARSSTGSTPLHVAARAGHGQIVELLLNRGANVDDHDENGNTALYFAAENGCSATVKFILKFRPSTDDEKMKNPLCAAVMGVFEDRNIVIKDLLDYGFTVTPKDADNYLFLHHAIINGDVEIVRDLLKYTTEDNLSCYRYFYESPPLHCAAMYRRKEIVEMLLAYGVDANATDFTGATPMCSLMYGTTRYIQKVLMAADPGEYENIEQECRVILEILLQHGADPKIEDGVGMTVLHYTAACNAGMEEIAKLLLRNGVDVKIASDKGSTPLSIATYKGNKRLVRVFLEHGGLDFSRNTDREVLEFVSGMEYREYFSIPLELHLVDINSVDDHDTTALQFAYESGYDKLVRILLEHGADVNAGNTKLWRGLDKYLLQSGDVIKKHILKLYAAGLKVPIYSFLSHDYELMDLADDCQDELENMKNAKIADTIISFSDILTENVDQLAAYAENESIISSVESFECKKLYPLYTSVMRGFLWRGVIRRGLLKRGREVFRSYSDGLPELPDICVKNIFKYLTNEDLRILIRSCQEASQLEV